MKYLVLFLISLGSYSFTIKDKNGVVSLSLQLRKINSSRILDPTHEYTEFNFNKVKYTFKTKDIFLKEYDYSKEIYAVDKDKHLHIKLKKTSTKSFYSIINLRKFKDNSHFSFKGQIQLKSIPYVNQSRLASQ